MEPGSKNIKFKVLWINNKEKILMSVIKKLTLSSGTELVNVPAQREVLLELGVSEPQIEALIKDSKWPEIREKRNLLLKQSDWTQLLDSNLEQNKKNKWKTYREALRNIPQDNSDPENISWPEEPK